MNGHLEGSIAEPLISRDRLNERLDELASELTATLPANRERPPLLIGVLKGSTLFLADLIRRMQTDLAVDFMSISTYASQSGVVRIIKDLDTDVRGRDIVIVEDIVDTGLSLNYLRKTLGERGPGSLQAVTLLDKVARRIVPVPVEHRGFEIPDVFVLGYGLDFQGRYRNVDEILAVKDIATLANDPLGLVRPLFGRS